MPHAVMGSASANKVIIYMCSAKLITTKCNKCYYTEKRQSS